jgi:small subunit ribosomal protein S6
MVYDAHSRSGSPVVQEEASDVHAMMRGRHRMAYPVKGNWEGIYVLFSYIAKKSTTPKVQRLLSTPSSGSEDNILRHMTFLY